MEENINPASKKLTNKILGIFPKIVGILLIFILGIWVGQTIYLPFTPNKGPLINISGKKTPSNIQVDFSPFWDTWDKVTTTYLEKNKINPEDLVNGAIRGMVESLGDPYTVYLDPKENQEFNLSLSGIYEGVGLELDIRDDQLIVVSPIDGTPASKAGVLAGDKILKIDDEDTYSMSITQAVQQIRGKKGEKVVLTLERNGKTLVIPLVRDKIVIASVIFEDMGDGVAKIKVTRFGDNTFGEWNKAVNKLVAGNYQKLILDLRNNPGGRLDYSIKMAGDFLPEGSTVVIEEDASGKRTPYKSETPPKMGDVETIVLINKGSASASEIVSGALRDVKKIQLVGETSFGKGTIQRVDPLPKNAGLHITFAKWLTPNGTWVHKKGLQPDIEVKMTEKDIETGKDPQLQKALEMLN